MAVTIKGIRLSLVLLERNLEGGGFKINNAQYELISSVDKVLAKQPIGGYGGMVLEPSPLTVKALDAFVASYTEDIINVLGLSE